MLKTMNNPIVHEDFLLKSDLAKKLYYKYTAQLPIIYYHCHLSPKDIAQNRKFKSLTQIWLEGDHYKWSAMSANGIDSLEWYQIIESDLDVVVTPAWRPDRAMYVRDAGVFIQYLTKFPN